MTHPRPDPTRTARLFDFMSIFSLPWYAAIGTNKALGLDLPYVACVLIGVVGPSAGRYFIDITSGVTPKHFPEGSGSSAPRADQRRLHPSVYRILLDLAGHPHRVRSGLHVPVLARASLGGAGSPGTRRATPARLLR